MRSRRLLVPLLSLLIAPLAHAQSTDGFHASQIIPVVVDTASYTTRLSFTNGVNSSRVVHAWYLPAEGTSQVTELDCGTFTMAGGQVKTFSSLRDVCPALPGGSQFGTLHTTIAEPLAATDIYSYAAYARVQNPQGIGFSVEGFPAHTLTGASVHVAGIRRLAATSGSPAYQTNCFVGSINHVDPTSTPFGTEVVYDLFSRDGALIASGSLDAPVGKLVRILDIFGAAHAPAIDYDDAQVVFSPQNSTAVEAFCTVQDNTTFSADFRIGKQYIGGSTAATGVTSQSPFAQDDHVNRRTQNAFNVPLTNGLGGVDAKPFVIPAGSSSNTHVVQFRHPDWVACDIFSGPVNGLEMRLVRTNGNVIAGGNNATSFGPVYLGDKSYAGTNSRYLIEVESAESNTGNDRPYTLRCRSGSGHSIPDLVRTGGPDQF